jgi:phosphate acetyltransferase
VQAARVGLISLILGRPVERIKSLATRFQLDISAFELADTPLGHAAAERAVEIVRSGGTEELMMGSLPTLESMGALVNRNCSST